MEDIKSEAPMNGRQHTFSFTATSQNGRSIVRTTPVLPVVASEDSALMLGVCEAGFFPDRVIIVNNNRPHRVE